MELKIGEIYVCIESHVGWWKLGNRYQVINHGNRPSLMDEDGTFWEGFEFIHFDERFKLVGHVDDFKPAEEPEEKELEERQEDINKAVEDMDIYEYMNYLMHQEYYEKNGIQPIDIMKANFTPEEYTGFLKGNILKYLLRYKRKNGVEDLAKAQVYLGWLLEHYKGESK